MSCAVCGATIPEARRRYHARYCSDACYGSTTHRSRRSAALWVNRPTPTPIAPSSSPPVDPSVRRAIDAAGLRPTPAEVRAALARIGRELGR